jgi:hypothetical protein
MAKKIKRKIERLMDHESLIPFKNSKLPQTSYLWIYYLIWAIIYKI